jgi:hypothetical protein
MENKEKLCKLSFELLLWCGIFSFKFTAIFHRP